jgi:hypothetical protein
MCGITLCCTFEEQIKVFHSTPFKVMQNLFNAKHKARLLPSLYTNGVLSQAPASF